MQDYNYVYSSCMEITLELSCCKFPARSELPDFWLQNKNALLAYLNEVHRGMRGIVADTNGLSIPGATLKIKGRKIPFKASNRGEFWRILLPGHYVLQITAKGYKFHEQNFVVQDGQVTYLDVKLSPEGSVSGHFVYWGWFRSNASFPNYFCLTLSFGEGFFRVQSNPCQSVCLSDCGIWSTKCKCVWYDWRRSVKTNWAHRQLGIFGVQFSCWRGAKLALLSVSRCAPLCNLVYLSTNTCQNGIVINLVGIWLTKH